jgi:hypothetical protein
MPRVLTILDWDDTLFPTSWVLKNNIDLTKDDEQHKYMIFFAKLDLLLYKILTELLKNGKVAIVTHAMTKWVLTSSKILPNTQAIIMKDIKIISARELFQKKQPDKLSIWKSMIFHNLVDYNKVQHIISVGDADYEFRALVDLYDPAHKRLLKSVRFMSSPSYDSLIDQLEVFNKNIKQIVNHKNHMDLKFEDLEK